MSQYYKSNLVFPDKSHGFTAEEAERLTIAEFDSLSLADQISLYNSHRHIYDRLTGKQTATDTETTPQDTLQKTDAQLFAEEFERRVDQAFVNVFGHKCGEID